MLKYGRDYADIGQEQYDNQFKGRALRSLARRAEEFGLQLVPNPEAVVPSDIGLPESGADHTPSARPRL
jgi:hypothetical protein